MRIGIDITPLQTGHKTRGIGFYTRNLVVVLKKYLPENEYILFKRDEPLPKVDVLHYPYFDFYFLTLPIFKKFPTVVTIHDVIPLIFKKQYPAGIKGELKFHIQKFSLKNTAAVICDSQNSKKDIIKYLGYPEEKIHVVYLAASEIFKPISDTLLLDSMRVKYKLPEKFILYIGDVNWNKNIPTLINACKLVQTPLIICGKQALDIENEGVDLRSLAGPRDWLRFLFNQPHPELVHFRELAKEFKSGKIRLLGFVPDEDLVVIYNLATAYVQPSLYEGFGLPVLEAMVCGTPVICSNTSSLPEIAGEAVVYVDPENVESIKDGIEKVINNKKLQEELSQRGLLQTQNFSWQKTAEATLKVYKKVMDWV